MDQRSDAQGEPDPSIYVAISVHGRKLVEAIHRSFKTRTWANFGKARIACLRAGYTRAWARPNFAMTRIGALGSLLLLYPGCAPPESVVEAAFEHLQQGREVERFVANTYADGVGDRKDLLDWLAHAPVSNITVKGLQSRFIGPGRTSARVEGTARIEFLAFPLASSLGPVTRTGRIEVDLQRDGRFRIASGFLTETRASQSVIQSLLECAENQFSGCEERFDSGFRIEGRTAADWLRKLKAHYPLSVRVRGTRLRLEVRDDLVHADLHCGVTYGNGAETQFLFRVTLVPLGGGLSVSDLYFEPR